jgi:multidrug efflux pump subunit AcrA (membrane-fusion protein)
MIPLTQAYVYARANGYLKKRLVDIGDHVRKDQLLAIIDAPDLDAQVIQAREQVAQAQQQLEQQRSQLALNTVTVQRYRVLVAKGVFSRQDGDTQEANYASQVANVAAAQRNVEAYKGNLAHQLALQSYEYVRAPFAGVITERDVDEGALISASGAGSGQAASAPQGQSSSAGGTTQAGQSNNSGASGGINSSATSSQSPGQGGPLFGIAQVQRLRILVSVPEGYATAIHVGQHAPIAVQEYPGVPLTAEVTRTADSIDANTRTMLTELQIDNTAGKLLSGMYAVVTFPPAADAKPPILISGDALAIRHDRSMVATVVNGRIRFVPVVIGRDFGSAVEILDGLKVGDVIVIDVTDEVVDNAEVTTHTTKSPNQQPQASPQQTTPPGGNTQYGNQGLTDQNLQGQQSRQNQKSTGKPQSKSNSNESKP